MTRLTLDSLDLKCTVLSRKELLFTYHILCTLAGNRPTPACIDFTLLYELICWASTQKLYGLSFVNLKIIYSSTEHIIICAEIGFQKHY